MPVPVNDVITQLTLLIDSKEYELVRGKLRYDQAIRDRLHKMSNELKALAATGQATDKQVKAIIDREYFRAYVDERTKTGAGKTNKETPLLDIFENKDTGIVAHAFDVLVASGKAKASDNFLIPPNFSGSKLESALAETITNPQTLREILFQTLSSIHAAARVSPPDVQPKSASKEAKAKYKSEYAEWEKNNKETYDAHIQKFANSMKIVARLTKEGKEIWNGIVESEINNHPQARMMSVDMSYFKFTNDKDFSEGKLKDSLAPKILYGDHGNGPRMQVAQAYLAENAAILSPTPAGPIPVRADFVTYLKLLIDQQATQLDGKNLVHTKDTIRALERVSAELAALPPTASPSDVKDIMDKAYASAYITDRTLGGVLIEGTVKGPLIKLYEKTIFPHAMDVQKAMLTAAENFLNPPESKDDQSFETRLFQTISDANVTEIFVATLRAYQKASPPSHLNDPALQQFANGVKAAARFSETGRAKWNELVQQVGGGATELQITKSGLKKDLYSESNIKKSILPEMKTKETDAAVAKFLANPALGVRPSVSVTPSVAQSSASRPSESVSVAPPPPVPARPAGRISPAPTSRTVAADVPPPPPLDIPPPPPADIPPPPPFESAASRRASEAKAPPSPPPAPAIDAGRKNSGAVPSAPPMAPPMTASRKNSGAAPDAPPPPAPPMGGPSPSHTGMFKPGAAGGRGALLQDITKGAQLKKVGDAQPAAKMKESSTSRSGLLDEIKGGAKLRKVEVSQSKGSTEPSGSTTPVSQGAISSNLASRVEEEMKKRNKALSGNESESDDSDNEWDEEDSSSYSSPKKR